VISADSRQVYRGLDIGTGKDLSAYIVRGQKIPYHLIDVAEPETQFYLHDFIRLLGQAFMEISARSHLPVICGGTGLYLDAIRKDFSYTQVPENEALRAELKEKNRSDLLSRLSVLPADFVAKVDKTSVKRLIRGIEVGEYLQKNKLSPSKTVSIRPVYIGIDPGKEILETRIRQRLEKRLGEGMVKEAETLIQEGVSYDRLERFGLEYKFLARHVRGELTLEELKRDLCIAIRQFAKRQMTWFRKMEKEGVRITWLKDPVVPAGLVNELRASLNSPQ
jgi:tRNA dimethylallyltransferase